MEDRVDGSGWVQISLLVYEGHTDEIEKAPKSMMYIY